MNMDHVVKINNVVCQITGQKITMFGRRIILYVKSNKIVENHILTGKFTSRKIKL